MYAGNDYDVCLYQERTPMHGTSGLKRKSFFVDENTLRRAKKLLGASTDAEAIRLSMERVVEMEAFWKLMQNSRNSLPPGSMEKP